jgi:hypothetical protein
MIKTVNGYRFTKEDGLALVDIRVDSVSNALAVLREQYACQGWEGIIPVMSAVQTVLDNFELIEVVDAHGTSLVAYSAEIPWFTSESLLVEEFIVGDAALDTVVDALEAMAKAYGCTRLVLGTRAVRDAKHFALSKLYERTGCSVSCVELSKPIPNQPEHT